MIKEAETNYSLRLKMKNVVGILLVHPTKPHQFAQIDTRIDAKKCGFVFHLTYCFVCVFIVSDLQMGCRSLLLPLGTPIQIAITFQIINKSQLKQTTSSSFEL